MLVVVWVLLLVLLMVVVLVGVVLVVEGVMGVVLVVLLMVGVVTLIAFMCKIFGIFHKSQDTKLLHLNLLTITRRRKVVRKFSGTFFLY